MKSPRKPSSPSMVLQLKVTLADVRPPIWRRLLVPSNIDLHHLHVVIQAAFGWENYHLYLFDIGGTQYSEPHSDYDSYGQVMRDSLTKRLESVVRAGVKSFRYEYDFGDGWYHRIVIEKVLTGKPNEHVPRCLAGKRSGPLEDSGGPWGYVEKLQIAGDPSHPEHEEIAGWLGAEFDPERFSLDEINAELKSVQPRRVLPD